MEKNKKVFIVGGTGRTGKIIIDKLLNRNYHITALTRDLNHKNIDSDTKDKVNWFKGDIQDIETYKKELKNHNIVISLLGGNGKNQPIDLYYDGYTKLLHEMDNNKVNKLIAVTADHDNPTHNWFFRWVVKPLILKNTFLDIEKTEKFIKNEYKGNVNYTLVRPFRLLDGELGNYRYQNSFSTEEMKPNWNFKTKTGDVADFCIKIMEENSFVNEFITIGE